ncbi:hypothetical protein [uncultured Gardnerella sp.]|uniref:Uncharacterized protein n=1 Tax=Gardnerella vaginalis TaxID=2702 RepID=A0A135Z480_GARVA|nr:hypothetical protein [uncultured Gardnerella sp.]KXI16421.1 hypothetical protein HMPREF3230_01029 [Gardnerella vaginalis]
MPHLRDTLHYDSCITTATTIFAQPTKVGSLLPSLVQNGKSWKSTSKLDTNLRKLLCLMI